MKAKLTRGAGFRGVVDYAFADGKGAEIVGGNMAGQDPRSLAAEFGLVRQMRPSCERPVWHCSLSAAPGERLSAEQWEAVATHFMRIMEFGDRPYVVVRNTDTDNDHVHIVASRIGLDGTLWHGQFEVPRALRATQQLERDHGLTLTRGYAADDDTLPEQMPADPGDRMPTRAELAQADRTDDAPIRLRLQELLTQVLDQPQTVLAFMDRLEAAGVTVIPNVATTGKMNGFSFELEGVPFKGSQIGKAYAWKALQERGVGYEQARDGESLRARADAVKRRLGAVGGGEPTPAPADLGGVGRINGDGHDRPQPHDGHAQGAAVGVDAPSADRPGPGDRGDPEGDLGRAGGLPDLGPNVAGDGPASVAAAGPLPPDGLGDGLRGRAHDWRGTAELLADLAAPDDPGLLDGGPGDQELTPSHRAKLAALKQQHAALGSPAYRLTLMSRVEGSASFNVGKGKGEGGAERFYTAEDVQRLVPYLSGRNAAGYDVYLTPIDPAHHYLLVDDMTPEHEAGLRGLGITPALVQDSSAGNRQAIVKVERQEGLREQSAANRLMAWLNQRFGDPKISGVVHPFRAAGFSNKKPGRGDAFTRVVEATGVVSAKAAALLEAFREQLRGPPAAGPEAAKATRTARPLPRPIQPAPEGLADARFDELRRREEALAQSKDWTPNDSVLDYRAAAQMLAEGHDREAVAGAMLRRSPGLLERHSDAQRYIDTTLDAAGRRSRPEADEDTPRPG